MDILLRVKVHTIYNENKYNYFLTSTSESQTIGEGRKPLVLGEGEKLLVIVEGRQQLVFTEGEKLLVIGDGGNPMPLGE